MFSCFNKYSQWSFPFLPFRKDLVSRYYLFCWTEYVSSNKTEMTATVALVKRKAHIIHACELTPLLWCLPGPPFWDNWGFWNCEFSCLKRIFRVLSTSPTHTPISFVQVSPDHIGSPRLEGVPASVHTNRLCYLLAQRQILPLASTTTSHLVAALPHLIWAKKKSLPIKASSKILT